MSTPSTLPSDTTGAPPTKTNQARDPEKQRIKSQSNLEKDPFDVDEIKFKDQKIYGTIKGGMPHIIDDSAE